MNVNTSYRKATHRTTGVEWFLCVVAWCMSLTVSAQVVIGTDIYISPGSIVSISADSMVLANASLINQGQLHIGKTGQKVDFTGLLYQDGGITYLGASTAHIRNYTSTADAELRMAGTAPQILAMHGNAVERLVSDNPTTVTLLDSVYLAEVFNVAQGSFKTTATGHLNVLPNGSFQEHTPGAFAGIYKQEKPVSGLLPVHFGPYLTLNANGNNLGNVKATISSGLSEQGVTFKVNPNNAAMRSIDRVWDIEPENQPSPSLPVSVELRFNPALENAGMNLLRTQVWKTPKNANSWSKVGTVVNGLTGTISTTTTSFSTWTVSSENSPLPLTLLSFYARKEAETAVLTWVSQWEMDVDKFIIERSTDGVSYEAIGTLPAKGVQNLAQQYNFTDPTAGALGVSVVYYRLKEVNAAQHVHIVGHAALPWQQDKSSFRLFPNPMTDHFFLDLAMSQEANLWLVNELGQTVWTGTYAANMGHWAQQFTLPKELPVALYILHAEWGGQRHIFKVVKH